MTIKAIVQRHPVAAYFVLAYGIAWGGSIAVVGPKFVRREAMQLTDALFIFLPMLAGSSLAGPTITAIVDGRSGLRDLLSRMGKWRVDVRWYAAAILIPPVLISTDLLALTCLVSPVFTPHFSSVGIIPGLLARFFEEIGWMGYAFPEMALKRTSLAAGLGLGLLWTVWRAAADYPGASSAFGVCWLPHFLVGWLRLLRR